MNKVNFNNETVRQAVNEWINEKKLAESKYGHISKWDTSEEVTDMKFLFSKADAFNQDIGNWNLSKDAGISLMFD